MHIPNGFLTDPVCTASTLAAGTALGVGFFQSVRQTDSRDCILMAATGAGIFAAQMINFPIDHGTSGHVLGATLAAIALGPWRGMLTMAMVLAVQCLLFGDGGLIALGANVLNMAVAATLTAAGLYAFTTRRVGGTCGVLLGTALAGIGSVIAAATLCSVELAASGTYGLGTVLTAMLGVHAVIGVAEALISVAVVAAVLAARRQSAWPAGRVMAGGLIVAAAVAGLLAPVASEHPDGLERVATELNIAELARPSPWAIAPDYAAPGIAIPALAVSLAGIAGVVVVFAGSYTLGRAAAVRVRKR